MTRYADQRQTSQPNRQLMGGHVGALRQAVRLDTGDSNLRGGRRRSSAMRYASESYWHAVINDIVLDKKTRVHIIWSNTLL